MSMAPLVLVHISTQSTVKFILSLFFQMKPIIYSLFNYPHFVITGPKNLAPASKLQLQSPQPPRVLVLHDLFWSGDNIFFLSTTGCSHIMLQITYIGY